MLGHSLKGIFPRRFAYLGERFDVAADDLLEPAEKSLGDVRRAYHNSADDTHVFRDRMPGDLVPGSHDHRFTSLSRWQNMLVRPPKDFAGRVSILIRF